MTNKTMYAVIHIGDHSKYIDDYLIGIFDSLESARVAKNDYLNAFEVTEEDEWEVFIIPCVLNDYSENCSIDYSYSVA